MPYDTATLAILIIDEDDIRASIIKEGLRAAGHVKVTVISQVSGLLRRIEESAPDVIVIDLANPNRDLLEHMFLVSRAVRKPIAMFVDKSDPGMMEAAIEAGVSAYVVDGLRQNRVKSILDMAVARFNAYSRLREELEDTRQALEDRKILDRAKGILMASRKLSEPEAHRLIRSTAMQESRRIADVARAIVTAERLMTGGGS